MFYEYVCRRCGGRTLAQRQIAERDAAPPCTAECGPMERVLSTSFVLNAHLCKDAPENKYALGYDQKDRLATMNQMSRDYARKHARDKAPAETPDVPLAQLFHEVSQEVGVRAT